MTINHQFSSGNQVSIEVPAAIATSRVVLRPEWKRPPTAADREALERLVLAWGEQAEARQATALEWLNTPGRIR